MRRIALVLFLGLGASNLAVCAIKPALACETVGSINLIASDHRAREVSLDQIDVDTSQPPIHSTDPAWHVVDHQSGDRAGFEWLQYITTDPTNGIEYQWGVKVHCEAPPSASTSDKVHCWFKFDGGDNHDDNNLRYLNPGDYKPLNATINLVAHWPANPTFCVSPAP